MAPNDGKVVALPIQPFRPRIRVCTLFCVGAPAAWLPLVSAQTPSPPVPSPTPGPGGSEVVDVSPAGLADRVRKLEEMNQTTARMQYTNVSSQYQKVTRQNEELSRTVQVLSKRLEESNRGPRSPAPGRSGGGLGGEAGGGSDFEPALDGRARPPRQRVPKVLREGRDGIGWAVTMMRITASAMAMSSSRRTPSTSSGSTACSRSTPGSTIRKTRSRSSTTSTFPGHGSTSVDG